MNLLTTKNQKLEKGNELNYMSFGLHLAPSTLSGYNTCPSATPLCAKYCLNTSGHGAYSNVQDARIRKTKYLFENRKGFIDQLKAEITLCKVKAMNLGMVPCFRLNVVSDIPWELDNFGCIPQSFPDVIFYDYTKIRKRVSQAHRLRIPVNYHLTFSCSETSTDSDITELITGNVNVATVFQELPSNYIGFEVVNGDVSDLRFLDKKGVIVGLTPKGRARRAPRGEGFIK